MAEESEVYSFQLARRINDDPDYSHRQALYGQIMTQYYRYLRNVMYNIGGIYLTEVKEGTPGSVTRQCRKHVKKHQWHGY